MKCQVSEAVAASGRDPSDDSLRWALVVEDEPLTRGLVASVLDGAGFAVVQAADAVTAIGVLREVEIDVLILDLNLGAGPGGTEVLVAAEKTAPWLAIVVLTDSPTPEVAGLDPGLIPSRATYLHKRSVMGGQRLLEAVQGVLADESPIRDDLVGNDPIAALSHDQLEVLRLVAEGLSNTEIGVRRGTSAHAVEQVFRRVLRTLGVPRDRAVNPRVLAARIYYSRGSSPT